MESGPRDHPWLLESVRRLVETGADERVGWIRGNLRGLMHEARTDAVGLSALSGVSATTVRAFLTGTDSSISNVLRMAIALGVSIADLEQPPEQFAERSKRAVKAPDGSAA